MAQINFTVRVNIRRGWLFVALGLHRVAGWVIRLAGVFVYAIYKAINFCIRHSVQVDI